MGALAPLEDSRAPHGPAALTRFPMCYGPELTAKALRAWLERLGVGTLFIAPGSPWENGYRESLIGKLRDELLDREIFYSLREAEALIAAWRRHDHTARPHSALGYRPPAPEATPWPIGACPPSTRSGLGLPAVLH